MNTLSKQMTASILGSEEAWLKLRKKWGQIMQDPEAREKLGAEHHLLANAALGRDWRKGFTPIDRNTHKGGNKLKSFISPHYALYAALQKIQWTHLDPHGALDPFEGAISVDAFERLKQILPHGNTGYLAPFEDDAYTGAPVL